MNLTKDSDTIKAWGLGAALAIIITLLGVIILRALPSATTTLLGHGGPLEQLGYDALGTVSAPTTLTTGYGGTTSSILLAGGLPNLVISGSYKPKSYGSVAYLLLERSTDGGTTYYPYQTLTSEASDVLVNTSGSSTTNGSPFIIPGNGLFTAASGTAIAFSFDVTGVADYWRVRSKESTTSTAGTLYLRALLQSN